MGSEVWLERFCHSLNVYFDGLKAEIPGANPCNSLLAFSEFVSIREKAVNVYPLVDFRRSDHRVCIAAQRSTTIPAFSAFPQLTCHILSGRTITSPLISKKEVTC